MLNIGELRSMQYWDADNQVSDLTEQRANRMSNLFFDMIDTVSKRWRAQICRDCDLRSRKAQLLGSLHDQLSCSAVSLRMQSRPRLLDHNACLNAIFQNYVQNGAHLGGQDSAA